MSEAPDLLHDAAVAWDKHVVTFNMVLARLRAAEAEVERLRERARLGYELSTYAAAIHWDRSENTQEWMDGLRERIEAVQALTPEVK